MGICKSLCKREEEQDHSQLITSLKDQVNEIINEISEKWDHLSQMAYNRTNELLEIEQYLGPIIQNLIEKKDRDNGIICLYKYQLISEYKTYHQNKLVFINQQKRIIKQIYDNLYNTIDTALSQEHFTTENYLQAVSESDKILEQLTRQIVDENLEMDRAIMDEANEYEELTLDSACVERVRRDYMELEIISDQDKDNDGSQE